MSAIKEPLTNNPVYVMLDETKDSKKRNVLNILIGSLNGEETVPRLAAVSE